MRSEPGSGAAASIYHATYDHPLRPATGVEHVLVDGEPVWAHGAPTTARPGRVVSQ